MQTIICMKWGSAYGADYANKLYAMVRRNTARPLRFICFTDDPTGLLPEIEALPLPAINLPERRRWEPWRKLSLWQRDLAGLSGNVLFLDLDVVVTGPIDAFFDFQPERSFCVIENWTQRGKGIGNTSVFRLKVGAHPEVFEALGDDPAEVISHYANEQTMASRIVGDVTFWPLGWCVSFKHETLPSWPANLFRSAPFPEGARIVVFMGHPNPDEARDGRWPAPWYKKPFKQVRPTPWIAEHWR